MWETAVRKHEESLIQKGMLLEKQQMLIELLSIKFGKSDIADSKAKSVANSIKLDKAIRKVLSAKSREEVLKCLD